MHLVSSPELQLKQFTCYDMIDGKVHQHAAGVCDKEGGYLFAPFAELQGCAAYFLLYNS